MKNNLLRHAAMFGTAALLTTFTVIPAFAANVYGHLDTVSANQITGWAWNADLPSESVTVELTISSGEDSGAYTQVLVPAELPREDLKAALGSESHGYVYMIDWTQFSGETFTVTASAVYGTEKYPLLGSFTYTKPAAADVTAITAAQEALGPGFAAVQVAENTLEETAAAAEKAAAEKAAAEKAAAKAAAKKAAEEEEEETASKPAPSSGEAGEYLGEFRISGYCNCSKCSGGYTLTYSGTVPQGNHTISADLNRFPIGTELYIDGIIYTVEDKGSNINGDRLDIYFDTHAEALAFGLQYLDVYAVE